MVAPPILSRDELWSLAITTGFSNASAPTACAIAEAESSRGVRSYQLNRDGSVDRGLWQINSVAHREISDACAYDQACAARAAFTISSGGRNWSPWTTFTSGQYRQFLPAYQAMAQSPITTAVDQLKAQTDVTGQAAINKLIKTPWLLGGPFPITQGYGATPNTYAKDHGTTHWHSGVDIGCPCGSTVVMPAGTAGTAIWLDNPQGYGTALIIRLAVPQGAPGATAFPHTGLSSVDIYLGHLRQRLVSDGQAVHFGDHLAITNNTGDSTGCHMHFEVRPVEGKYGTDIDPAPYLFTPSDQTSGAATGQIGLPDIYGVVTQIESDLSGIPGAVQAAEQSAMRTAVGLAQEALGAAMLLGGLVATGYSIRHGTRAPAVMARHGRQLMRRPAAPAPQPQAAPLPAAARARIRPGVAPPKALAPPKPTIRMTADEYQIAGEGVSLQRQRQLGEMGIRVRPGSAGVGTPAGAAVRRVRG